MIVVYFDKLAICFNENIEDTPINFTNIEVPDVIILNKIMDMLHNGGYDFDINLYGYDSVTMFNDFCKMHNYIEAAGGVVLNENSEYLLIKRFGIWDLPKGKVEEKETIEAAAIREVCEETGLSKVGIVNQLPCTYHIYNQKNKWFLKKTYWFLMKTSNNVKLVPETEEDISVAIWMTKFEAYKAISETYRSIKEGLGYLFG